MAALALACLLPRPVMDHPRCLSYDAPGKQLQETQHEVQHSSCSPSRTDVNDDIALAMPPASVLPKLYSGSFPCRARAWALELQEAKRRQADLDQQVRALISLLIRLNT